MALKFIFGASGSGKSTYVTEKLVKEAEADANTLFMLIVPDQFTMQTQMDVCLANERINGKRGILNIDVLSFGRLTHRIFEEVGTPKEKPLDDTGKCLIVRRVISEHKDELSVLSNAVGNAGYIQEIKSVISEFMQYSIKPDDLDFLKTYSESKPYLKVKLEDLKIIYKAFLESLGERYTTTEETLELLSRKIPGSKLVKKSVIVFDGFTGFTPVQNGVIETLIENAKDVCITLPFEAGAEPFAVYSPDYLFGMTQNTVKTLQKKCERMRIPVECEGRELLERPVVRFEDNKELLHLEKNILRNRPFKPYTGKTKSVEIVKTLGIRDECKCMCDRMFELIRDKGYRYRDIAVVCSDLELYDKDLSSCLKEYNVPFYIDTTRDLQENPFIMMLKSAMRIVLYNFRYDDVFAYLKSGFNNITVDERDRFENYCLAKGIQGRRSFERVFVSAESDAPDVKEAVESLNNTRVTLLESLSVFDGYRHGMKLPATEWMTRIYNFLTQADCEKRLADKAAEFTEEGNMLFAKTYEQIYRAVMGLFDQVCSLLGEEKITLEEIFDILSAGFAEFRIGTIPLGVDSLHVGDIERSRIKNVKALFFLGVNAGKIPSEDSGGGILSSPERVFLEESGMEFAPGTVRKMYIQRLYLYLNLTKPSEHLYISYATVDNDGKSMMRSYLIDEILKLFPELKIQSRTNSRPVNSYNDALERVSGLMGALRKSELSKEDSYELISLYGSLLSDEHGREILKKCKENAFFVYEPKELSGHIADAVYGEVPRMSISSLETFAKCPYAHFLSYGLRLSERRLYEIRPVDVGNLCHRVMELYSLAVRKTGKDFADMTEEENRLIVAEAVEQATDEAIETGYNDNEQNRYLTERKAFDLEFCTNIVCNQLKYGKLKPVEFEKKFEAVLESEDGRKALFNGKIDRIDLYSQDDEIYVKIVDYKTGKKDFSIDEVVNGTNLQLSIYMDRTLDELRDENPGKRVIPAAMLYQKIFYPMLEHDGVPDDDEAREGRFKDARTTGLVNMDAARLLDGESVDDSPVVPVKFSADGCKESGKCVPTGTFEQYLSIGVIKALETAGRIVDGDIAVSPVAQSDPNGNDNSVCRLCSYRGKCPYDSKIDGYEVRDLASHRSQDDAAIIEAALGGERQ